MLRLTCFALLVTLALSLELQAKIGSQWKKFKSMHGKKYSGDEEQKRKVIFKKNVESILKHNLEADLGEASFTMGINEFSDMDHDEFLKVIVGIGGMKTLYHNRTAPVWKPSKNFRAPAALDWNRRHAVTSVKNQGYCRSCWAFSAIGSIEGAWALKHGELIDLSPQNLVDCTNNQKYDYNSCKRGGFPDNAMKYVYENGINTEQCYKYKAFDDKCRFKRNCRNIKLSGFYQVPMGNEKGLLEAVTKFGPTAVCIDYTSRSFQHYKRGVFEIPRSSREVCVEDHPTHCVTLVGYGTQGGEDYWLLKNSFGENWGEKGYFKMLRNKNLCGIASWANFATVL